MHMCTIVNMHHNNHLPQNMYFVFFVFLFGNFMYIFLYLKENRRKSYFFFFNNQLYFFSCEWDSHKIGLFVVSNEGLLCIMTDFWTFMWINMKIIEMLDFALINLSAFCIYFFEYQFCFSNYHVFLTVLVFCVVLLKQPINYFYLLYWISHSLYISQYIGLYFRLSSLIIKISVQ